jgi:VWFA-related protein
MRRCFHWIAFCFAAGCFAASPVYSQITDAVNSSETTFQAKVHVVVEDVVVTDRKGEPVKGLKKEDFQIFEEGKPQTIASFEEHKGVPDQAAMPPLPHNIYTNYPVEKPADSVDVVLLDALNTPLSDQSKVRLQIASFLKSIPAGSHIAIFTLSSGLQMVQGFTSDGSLLLAALNKKPPQPSPLLGAGTVENLDTEINKQLSLTGAGMPAGAVAAMEKMQQFQNQTQASQDRLRMNLTLQALQGLANYLQGIPGRKNVVWFSQSFPLSIIPGRGVQNYEFSALEQRTFRKTMNMLAAAQVAIYPIAPEGVAQKFVSNESRVKSVSKDSWRTVQDQQLSEVTSPIWDTDESLREQAPLEHSRRDAHLSTMYEIARDTGGEAFYYTNGLSEALAHVVNEGAHYYTISYSPTDKEGDGRYRPIEVKLLKGDYELAYRHGYYAEEARRAKKDEAERARDPLQPLMISGIPDATQIVYKIRVLPLPPAKHGSKAADRSAKKELKGPYTRYGVDFAVLLHDLVFKVTAEGKHEAKVEIALVAYDQDGIPVNFLGGSRKISLNPQQYAAFAKTGVQLHEEINVPNREAYLRTGVCDLASGRAGTLEVPLNEAASRVVATK